MKAKENLVCVTSVMKTYILAYKGSNSQPLSIYVKPLNIMITYMIHSYNKYIIHY